MKLSFLLCLVFVFVISCHHSLPHPNSLNKIDSDSYDALLVTQALIDKGREEISNGNLPQKMKPLLNNMVTTYNIARESWLAYRKLTIATNEIKLKGDLQSMSIATTQFKNEGGIK